MDVGQKTKEFLAGGALVAAFAVAVFAFGIPLGHEMAQPAGHAVFGLGAGLVTHKALTGDDKSKALAPAPAA